MKLMSDAELKRKGFSVLLKELGEVNMLRFLSQISQEKKDYMEIQDALFKDMTIDEIYKKAKDYEKKKESDS